MKIVVKCTCGKILRLPMEYAGRHAKCPQCSKLNLVPKLNEEESATQIEVRSCPTCGLFLSDADEVCVSCYTNLKTGEWDASKIKRKGFLRQHWQAATYAILLGCISILSIRLWQKDQEISTFLAKEQGLKSHSREDLQEKWQRLHNFENRPSMSDLKGYRIALWKELHKETLQEQTVLQKWMTACYLRDEDVINKMEKDLLSHLHLHQTNVEQLQHEQRYGEIVTRITPKLLEEVFALLSAVNASPRVKEGFQKLIHQYRGNTKNAAGHDVTDDKKRLRDYQKNFKNYLKKFYRTMYERRYSKAQEELEKFWNDINALSYFEPENKLVQEIRQKLKDVQGIKRLIDTAQKGAQHFGGLKRKQLSLRNHKKIVGRIQKYHENAFHIVSGGKERRIKLSELSNKDIVFFALRENKDDDTYLNAAIFLGYEQNYNMAIRMLQRAQGQGASFQEIKVYQNWLQEMSKNTTEK
ncbi:hypothetical protein [Candidatus Uabimicrobium amorphum]|uniref:Uncharacterized protein n=1 Tax=Uabimicrobium amorphum TaxID=2596890 RepID=A0A5S9F505_UABAM|nr:hypothetical protein [Candidatus Uabimicrobium amorphum]BBM85653.1 hypothetical protein UABAM_04027 [Candidatus Uabimicrobium amorphum]